MTEQVLELKEEIKRLKERLKVIGREKSNLQMATDLIAQVSDVSDPTNIVDRILQILVTAIGGSNIAVYYEAEGAWRYTDVLGNKRWLDVIDDKLVKQSVEQKTFLKVTETDESKLTISGFPKTYETWVYPLFVQGSIFGAIRLQGMAIEHVHYRASIDPFIQHSALLLYHEVSNVRRLKVVYQKVSEAKEKVQQTHRLLNSVIENSPLAIIAFDLNKKITLWSTAAEDMFGWKTNKAVGKQADIMVSDAENDLQSLFRDILSEKQVSDSEIKCLKKDGSVFDASLSVSAISDTEGKIQGGMAIIGDISRRKEMEEHILQVQKMEAIGTLAGGIAHDFNNILSSVFGFTDVARMKLNDGEKIEDELDQVIIAGRRARDLVQQILTFSRQADVQKIPLGIAPLIKEVSKFLRSSLPASIEIRRKLNVSSSTVMADPTQIHRILMNLCTNAAHAMKDTGGVLTVRLEEVASENMASHRYSELEGGTYLRLSIADTGCGIPKEHIEKIFDPFYTTKKREEGTGLGLSVVHGIVKDMHGAISVDTEPGKGTTFHVLLPKYVRKVVEEKTLEPVSKVQKGKLLFVDDEKGIIRTGQRILERRGYEVVATTKPLEALEIFMEKPSDFDVVLTDLDMPDMTGLELSRRFLEIRPDIPVVLATGFSADITPEILKNAGVREMVMKPMIAGELAETVRRAMFPKNE